MLLYSFILAFLFHAFEISMSFLVSTLLDFINLHGHAHVSAALVFSRQQVPIMDSPGGEPQLQK